MADVFTDWLTAYLADIDSDQTLNDQQRGVLRAFAQFGERNRAYVSDGSEVDLWGFGVVPKMMRPVDGGWWVALHSLIEPTGLSYPDLQEAFTEELESGSGDADVLDWRDPEGGTEHHLPLVRHDFVMRVFAGRSPWRQEFFNNTVDLMAHAVVQHGVGGPALAEAIAGDGLPSEEEARRRAFSGPAAALSPDGD